MSSSAYFVTTDGGLQPAADARSPWAADMLHGRFLAGLAARSVEAAAADDDFRVTRLTVDMFRFPPMTPYQVTSRIVRDGGRVRVVEVSIENSGAGVAKATALLLRTGPQPDTTVWAPPRWDVPGPDDVPQPDEAMAPGGWELRVITPGGFWTSERKQVWARDSWQLVEGENLSPLVRAAIAADLPNPLANSGTEGLRFINADLTLFLARPPRSDWVGLDVTDHISADGIAIGSCALYDTDGPIGSSTVCALANASLELT